MICGRVSGTPWGEVTDQRLSDQRISFLRLRRQPSWRLPPASRTAGVPNPRLHCLHGNARQFAAKSSCSYNSPVTRERWAQIGITTQFLIVVRTLGEIFRLRHSLGASFSLAIAMPYVGGVLIAAISCWLSVTLFFFRRYTLAACVAAATVLVLLVYKISVIGR
jgi:hypothetical protein